MISITWLRTGVASFIVLGAATVALGQTDGSSVPPDVEKAVKDRLVAIQDAAQALDPDKVFSFVLENDRGALAQNGELFLTREEALQSTKRGFKGLKKVGYRFDQQHITLLSPTVALATGVGSSSATTDGDRTLNARFAQSVVLILTDGEWKVFHAHRSFALAK